MHRKKCQVGYLTDYLFSSILVKINMLLVKYCHLVTEQSIQFESESFILLLIKFYKNQTEKRGIQKYLSNTIDLIISFILKTYFY